MTVYTSNIPQPQDDPSDSQDQILQNFQTLNSAYGSSGDHYPWTNTAVATTRKHAKVTMPGLPTAGSPPGDVLPGPLAGNCSIFAQTINSQTTPFLVRDGLAPTAPLTNIWPLMPIKAFASFLTAPGVIVPQNSFNISTITQNSQNSWSVEMTNPTRTSTYGIFFMGEDNGFRYGFVITDTTDFDLNCNGNLGNGTRLNFIVVES